MRKAMIQALTLLAVMFMTAAPVFPGQTGNDVSQSLLVSQEKDDLTDIEETERQIDEEFKWLKEEAEAVFVVTASRVKEDIRKAASSISVITDEQIRQMGARHLMDVVRTVPGMSLRYGSDNHYQLYSRVLAKTWARISSS